MSPRLRRREALQALAAGLGAAWIGSAWALGQLHRAAKPAASATSHSAASATPLTPWLSLHEDGSVTVFSYVSDIGQGTAAALRAAVAHQLGLVPSRVRHAMAPLGPAHANPVTRNYATYGSLGARTAVPLLARAAAIAGEALRQAAAAHWQVAPQSCELHDGAVWHGSRQRPWGPLLADAAARPLPTEAPLRPGSPPAIADEQAYARVSGALVYGIDHHQSGLLHTAVARPPAFGARVAALRNRIAIEASAGVVRVVVLDETVAVVAASTWQAVQAVQALDIAWTLPEHGADSERLREQLRAAVQAGQGRTLPARNEPAFDEARTTRALNEAAQIVDLVFDVPYLAHLPLEPLSATVAVHADAVDLWLSTQAQQDTRNAVAALLGWQPEAVRLHSLPAGGGFGRRLEHDWVLQAVRIARALPGQPVKLTWTRDVELQAGYFRPAAAARVRLALDAGGAVTALRADLANPSLLEHTGLVNGPRTGLDWTATMGWRRQPYTIPAQHLSWTRVDPGVPCAYWRSVGASQNHFFYECALDVAAARSGQTPDGLRRRLLQGNARGLAFLEALLELGRWREPLASGHHRGLAMGAANGSISAHVVEVAVTAPGRYRLVRIAALIDAGLVLDERAVEGQLVGGTVFGLSAALRGGIRIENGRVMADNFADQWPLRAAELPPIVTRVLSHGDALGGVGEEGEPTIAPALANALFAATGRPVTRLPLEQAGWVCEGVAA